LLTALKLLATAGLGAGYLAVAFATTHPRTSPEYAAHYLHRTADCWDPVSERIGGDALMPPPETVEVGKLDYPEACRYLRIGWEPTESWGVWAHPERAMLHLPPRPGARAVALTFQAAPPPGPAIRFVLALDGQRTEAVIPAGTTQTVTLPLPPKGADVDILSQDHAVLPGLPPDARTSHINPILVRDHPPPLGTRHVGLGLVEIRYLP
jgi:hypothetical protein